ncbi:MAG: DUF4238 domain-containing protein [Ardenticatenaceae bacterium]|nr:DUF4238 domain-containing protein [Ardenticatenaceae bacterium]
MRQVTRDNHYVPKVYLKQWSDDGLHIWAYRLLVSHKNVPLWRSHSIDQVAFRRNLYTEIESGEEVDEFEKWLQSEFENPIKETIKKILKDNPLSKTDWDRLSSFLGAQDIRTPLSYMELTERWERTLPDLMQKTLHESVRKLEDEEFRKSIKVLPNDESGSFGEVLNINVVKGSETEDGQGYIQAEITMGRKLWLESQRFLLTETIKALKGHKWSIARPAPGFQWFTSDQPVIKLNYYHQGNYDFKGGWGKKGGNLFMPLSPRHLLFTKIGADIPDSVKFSSEDTRLIQKLIAERASRWIFAHEQLKIVSKLRTRIIDAEQFKFEEEQWNNWHKNQLQSEKFVKNSPNNPSS